MVQLLRPAVLVQVQCLQTIHRLTKVCSSPVNDAENRCSLLELNSLSQSGLPSKYENAIEAWDPVYESVCVPHGHCSRNVSWFGAKGCITIQFDDATIDGAVLEEAEVETGAWVFGGEGCKE